MNAQVGPSNDKKYPDIQGEVRVCFDGDISPNSGTLNMDAVTGLNKGISDGGVHVHSGVGCESILTQGGHYFKDGDGGIYDNGDPWYNAVSQIAPTGAKYTTDAKGRGSASFKFDMGNSFAQTVGRVVILHDSYAGKYARIACGVLVEEEEDVAEYDTLEECCREKTGHWGGR